MGGVRGQIITYNTEEESSSLSLKYLSRSHNVFPISTSHDSAGGALLQRHREVETVAAEIITSRGFCFCEVYNVSGHTNDFRHCFNILVKALGDGP